MSHEKNVRRGRPPIGRKAMTAAQRQARRREKQRRLALEHKELMRSTERRPLRPPYGYRRAKQKLQQAGHVFIRVHESLGEENGGVFVDGAYISSHDVIKLSDWLPTDRRTYLNQQREKTKSYTCDAVVAYMAQLQVNLAELTAYMNTAQPRQSRCHGSLAPTKGFAGTDERIYESLR